jgi:hypothetical protein
VSAYVLRVTASPGLPIAKNGVHARGGDEKNSFGRVSNPEAAVRLRGERRLEEAAGR